jgi:hypothetical protein
MLFMNNKHAIIVHYAMYTKFLEAFHLGYKHYKAGSIAARTFSDKSQCEN